MLHQHPPARIPNPGTYPFAPAVNASYTVGRDFVQAAMAKVFTRTTEISVDIETYGLGLLSRQIKSVSFSDDHHAVVFDPRDPAQVPLIQRAFRTATSIGVFGATFDVPSLYLNGLMALDDVPKVVDPLLYARLASPSEHGGKNLESLCDKYMQTGPGGELRRAFRALGISQTDGWYQFDLDRPLYLQGAASDPLMTHRLIPITRRAAYDTLTSNHPFGAHGVSGDEAWRLVEREQRLNRIYLKRSCIGLRVDFDYLERYQNDNARELAEAEEALNGAGLTKSAKGLYNAQRLAEKLTERGEMPPDHPRTAKNGQYKMTKDTMKELVSPLVDSYQRHKHIQHVGQDYIQKTSDMAINGRVHPVINVLAAVTGRPSSGSPPVDQFEEQARGMILPEQGDAFSSLDLSQGEPITIATMAKDVRTVMAYESGVSLYIQLGIQSGLLPRGTTKAMCDADSGVGVPALIKVYKQLKIGVLAQTYGQGLPLLTAQLKYDRGPYKTLTEDDWEVRIQGKKVGEVVPTFAQARKFKAQLESGWPKTSEFVQRLKHIAKTHRKIITVSGRIIPIPVGRYGVEAHKGVNYPCQGGQYDILTEAVLAAEDAGLSDAIYLTRFDEMLCSTSAAHDLTQILRKAPERLTFWAGGRETKLQTDRADYIERWGH
jgi:DNA polymerase-1